MSKVLCALVFVSICSFSVAAGKVKVFVLAGQSNMEGKAQNKLLEFQAKNEKTAPLFAHLREDDEWIVRDDVFIKFLGRHGGLTIGYGSPNRTGAELEFGNVVGDAFEEPVLLIKTAWGGRSIYKNFRPPSAGLPSDEALEEELAKAQERVKKNNERRDRDDPVPTMEEIKEAYGSDYRKMLAEVRETLENAGELFPELKRSEFEIAGLVWFQGWNDQYNGAELEYEKNMKHFIKDVRKDLGVADLPVVIGVMGQNGSKPAGGAMKTIQDAQLAMEKVPGFKGTVKAVRTDQLIDKAAEEQYPTWKENIEVWEKVGSDHPYHYLGSAIWFNRIGKGFGEAMLELMGKSAN